MNPTGSCHIGERSRAVGSCASGQYTDTTSQLDKAHHTMSVLAINQPLHCCCCLCWCWSCWCCCCWLLCCTCLMGLLEVGVHAIDLQDTQGAAHFRQLHANLRPPCSKIQPEPTRLEALPAGRTDVDVPAQELEQFWTTCLVDAMLCSPPCPTCFL
jgi:hypothetical protein